MSGMITFSGINRYHESRLYPLIHENEIINKAAAAPL